MRHLATIRKIKELRPIQNADRIEVALIDGWEVIVNKEDGFKVGDLVVYIEIDSVLPDKPEFEFMRKYKFRVKTIKLRGQVSQGLVLPMNVLNGEDNERINYKENDDVTDVLGIKKYDPEAAQEKVWYMNLGKKVEFPWWLKPFKRIAFIRNWWLKRNRTVANFPDFIVKTDEERIQNLPNLFEILKERNVPLTVTEKMDGTSATYFLKDDKFGVCSRNKWLLKDDGSPYWQIAKKYEIEELLKNIAGEHRLVVLQGEILGPSIQKNKYELSEPILMPFNLILDGVRCTWYDMHDRLTNSLLQCVPLVSNYTEDGVYNGSTLIIPKDWEIHDFVEFAKGESKERTGNKPREGIVCRNEQHHISFKVINPDFLLKEDE